MKRELPTSTKQVKGRQLGGRIAEHRLMIAQGVQVANNSLGLTFSNLTYAKLVV